MATLFLAIVEHRHGTDVFHAWGGDELMDDLYQYVKEWWHEFFEGEELPENKEEALQKYFEVGDESYTWQEIELGNMPDMKEMNKAVKELADMVEELIQDRGRRPFDFQVDIVKATEQVRAARQLIAKKKKGEADEAGESLLQGGSEQQGVPRPDHDGG
jgi:hypothetical protein